MEEVIRKAASVIAVREGATAPEVLILERSPASRFLPGYVVFPGGAADAGDAELAARWFGSAEEAARACAVRELVEETGLLLTRDGLVHGDLQSLDGRAPAAAQLGELARWVAPQDVPVRFDARYFVIEAGPDLEPRPDGTEIVGGWWISPAELLREWESGERRLYWPTWFTVQALARAATSRDLLDLRLETREPGEAEVEGLPRSVFWQD